MRRAPSAPSGSVPLRHWLGGRCDVLEALRTHLDRNAEPVLATLRLDPGGWEVLREEPLELPPAAALRFLHRQWEEGRLTVCGFLSAVPPEVLTLDGPGIVWPKSGHLVRLTQGIPVCGHAATGVLVAADNLAADGQDRQPYLALIDRVDARHLPLLSDQHCRGVLALRGSRADHFALLAGERGVPYLVLDGHEMGPDGLWCGERVVPFGTTLTVDFLTGTVYEGDGTVEVDPEGMGATRVGIVRRLLKDEPSPLPLRVSLDAIEDLGQAFPEDASGVGLLRTEHLVVRGGQQARLRRLMTPVGEEPDPGPIGELQDFFEAQFHRVRKLALGRPVAIRLLDFPLHELGGLPAEVNPMLALRGVRQGVRWPHLYRLQIEAIVRAVASGEPRGGPVEILVPLVATVGELELVGRWVAAARRSLPTEAAVITVGTMVETPAAAVIAGPLAQACDTLSFGTNDLTQLVLGLSREDYPPILRAYRRLDLFPHDPFQKLHPVVEEIIRDAVRQARAANPAVAIGLCGLHAADVSGVSLCADGVVDFLSVPLEQLSATKLRAIALMSQRSR